MNQAQAMAQHYAAYQQQQQQQQHQQHQQHQHQQPPQPHRSPARPGMGPAGAMPQHLINAPSHQQVMAQRQAEGRHPQHAQHIPQGQHVSQGQNVPGQHVQGQHVPHQHPHPQAAARPRSEMDACEAAMTGAARHRAPKPTDRELPDGIDRVVLGDGPRDYRRLREQERRIDSAILRKRLNAAARVGRLGATRGEADGRMRRRTLRLWIWNTTEGQPWQSTNLDENAFDFDSGHDATYRVTIAGRLLDDNQADEPNEAHSANGDSKNGTSNDAAAAAAAPTSGEQWNENDPDGRSAPTPQKRNRMSQFFRSISIELDRSPGLQPLNTTLLEWRKPDGQAGVAAGDSSSAQAEFDTIEFERKSDENIPCVITLHRDEKPERFLLSPALRKIVLLNEATREEAADAVWEYGRALGLLQDDEKRKIQCDELLRAVCGMDVVAFPLLPVILDPHLSPIQPVKLNFTIRVDPEYQSTATADSPPTPTIYDIAVADVPPVAVTNDPSQGGAAAASVEEGAGMTELDRLRQLTELDDQLAMTVSAVTHSQARRAFFESLARDPVTFLQRFASSQRRDLEMLLGDRRLGIMPGDPDNPSDRGYIGPEFRRGGDDGLWASQSVRESVGLMVAKPGR